MAAWDAICFKNPSSPLLDVHFHMEKWGHWCLTLLFGSIFISSRSLWTCLFRAKCSWCLLRQSLSSLGWAPGRPPWGRMRLGLDCLPSSPGFRTSIGRRHQQSIDKSYQTSRGMECCRQGSSHLWSFWNLGQCFAKMGFFPRGCSCNFLLAFAWTGSRLSHYLGIGRKNRQ